MPGRTAPTARTARRGAIGLGVVLVAQLMLVLDATVVNVALPHIQTDLGFSAAGLSWVLNAYTLAFGGLLLLGGRLGDVFGRLRTFEIGLAIFTVASLLGGLATTPGLAHRRAHPSGRRRRARRAERARPRDDERPERGRPQPRSGALHGRVVGRRVHRPAARRCPHRLRQLALDALRQRADRRRRARPRAPLRDRDAEDPWPLRRRRRGHRDPRLRRGRPRLHQCRRPRLDRTADARLVRRRRWPCSPSSCAPRAGSRSPLLPLALVRNRTRGGALVLMALVVGAQFSTFFLVTQYLQLVLGFSPVATGAAFLPLSLAIFATSRVSARLVAKVGPRPMLLVGTLGLTASFVWLSTMSTTSTYAAHLLGALVLNGVSAALVFMPVTVVVLGGVDRAQAGTVSGPAPDGAAARRRRRPRRHRQRLRVPGGPGPVRAGRRAGVPHVGDASPSWRCSSRPSCCGRARRAVRRRAARADARDAVAVAAEAR